MYFFKYREKQYWLDIVYHFLFINRCVNSIDATAESGRYELLINHSKTGPNSRMKLIGNNDKPHLILEACHDIVQGEEICFDYGERYFFKLNFLTYNIFFVI